MELKWRIIDSSNIKHHTIFENNDLKNVYLAKFLDTTAKLLVCETKIESFYYRVYAWPIPRQTNDGMRIRSNLCAYANIYAMALMRATVASLHANLESLLTIKSCRDEHDSPVSLDDERCEF